MSEAALCNPSWEIVKKINHNVYDADAHMSQGRDEDHPYQFVFDMTF
jgi:hypothetical protein